MKQFKNIILSIVILTTCLFLNSIHAKAAEETLDCSTKNILKEKSTGEQVKLLQKELISVVGCNLTADGIYGTKTKVCVREFQKINKLGQDGIVGPNTCKKLNTIYLSEKEAEKNNQPSSKQSLDCKYTLAINSKGERVKLLQKQLNEIMGCNLTADGLFGAKTKTCVIKFQKQNKLTQDGIVGNNTCKKLNEIYLNGDKYNQEEEKDPVDKEDNKVSNDDLICSSSNTLSTKSRGEQVKILQKKLNATMGCNLGSDGIFGDETKKCVQNFQKKMNLSADGVVGTNTCKKINKVYENRNDQKINKQGNETVLNCRNILSTSSKGEQVKLLQKELNEVMNCKLTADGSFGTETKNCIINFQKKNNLTMDGTVGASTCSKLNAEYLKNNDYIISNGVSIIRQKDSTSSKEIATAIYGTIFKVYGSTTNNGYKWYKIKYNNEYAYIKSTDTKKDGIVLDISSQTLKLFKNNKLSLEALVITGTKNKYDTPLGNFMLYTASKKTDTYLTDHKTYRNHVDYWMPFIIRRGIGFHDASWKTSYQFYNKNTYLTNGSHGCVNMQLADARTLYNSITKNISVYVVE